MEKIKNITLGNFSAYFTVEERAKHSGVNRNPPGCQTSRRISRTSRRSSSIGCRSLMIGRRSSAGILAWTSCQDPSRVEAIATLLLKEMFRSEPDDLYAHAARYLSDPKFKDLLADFKRSEDRLARDLLDQNENIYGDDLVTETRSQQMTRLYSLFGESEEPLAPRTP